MASSLFLVNIFRIFCCDLLNAFSFHGVTLTTDLQMNCPIVGDDIDSDIFTPSKYLTEPCEQGVRIILKAERLTT